jgi:TatD DNase family protein
VVPVSTLKAWCDHPKVVALGETGLDYYYSKDRSEQQKQSFLNHLQAGADLGLPVIVHTRDARTDTINLIKARGSPDSAGVLHCFTESWEMARQALDEGYYISISGIVTFRNADELRAVAKKVPLDRLLVETDSPYLAPVPYRGKSNQPRYVRAVAEYVAELRGLSLPQLAEQTSENFFRLFKRAQA